MRGETILIVDDEKLIRWSLKHELSNEGFSILEAENIARGIELLKEHDPDLMILDQKLPDGVGVDMLGEIKKGKWVLPVIMVTAYDKSDVAVQAMKLGAFDYVTKPVNIEELKIVIEKALESTRLKRQVAHYVKERERQNGFCGMIGTSPVMKRVFEHITRIAQSSGTTVLITGDSGTGKELAARAIHFMSDRKDKPLMSVNFSALTESLIESELFGYEKGAFTDARAQKKGLFELANGGTIFLDEMGDLSTKIQVKLLRVIEQKTFQRVGGTTDITVDVRIIAATNQPLEKLMEQNLFRADLYYRLNVASICLPPLTEREDDVWTLAEFFIQEFNQKFHKKCKGITPETKQLFLTHPWRGNVRELKNVLERAILLNDCEYIGIEQLEFGHSPQSSAQLSVSLPPLGEESPSLFEMEKQALLHALEKTNHNQTHAARLLKISRDTLRYRMKKHGIYAHE
ncbi:MAG: sigma-54-dependent Fis family transcriptional regulator [Bacteroidetes bacterium]|nr:MAG: sigma-54-dependent Fis family transcriptional regulator [Bacteroidota bacterium]